MVASLLVAGAACGGDTSEKTSQPATTASTTAITSPNASTTVAAVTTTTAAAGCLTVAPAFAARLTVPTASAIKETVPTKPGLYRKGVVWFVSTKAGATWVTNADPTIDESGLTYPLNAKARAASEVGVDVVAGSPVYEGLTDASPGAVRSRTCAGA